MSKDKMLKEYTVKDIVGVYISNNYNKSRTAKFMGLTYDGLRNYLKNNPAVNEALKEANTDLVYEAQGELIKQVKKGHLPAITYFLNNKGAEIGYNKKLSVDITENVVDTLSIISNLERKHADTPDTPDTPDTDTNPDIDTPDTDTNPDIDTPDTDTNPDIDTPDAE